MLSLTPNLKVNDVKETINFYREKLSFEVIVTVPDMGAPKLDFAIMKNGEATLMFQEKKNLENEYPILKGEIENKGLTLFIKVKDIEKLYENLKTTVNIVTELHTTFYSTKEFAIMDNNGFVLTFAE